jgi:hypothetical protein
MIHNVYVFSSNGEPIITLKLGSIAAPEAMVSGFLSAIQTFAKKLTGGEVQQVNAGNLNILMRRVEDNFVALACDQDDRDARLRLNEIVRIVHDQLGKSTPAALEKAIAEAATKTQSATDKAKAWASKGM